MKNISQSIFLSSFLLMAVACQKSENKTNNISEEVTVKEIDAPLETTNSGAWQAKLIPLNGKVSGNITGALNIQRDDDRFIIHVRFSGGPIQAIAHVQNIRTGTKCPTEEADLNQDGYVDAIESIPFYGAPLIPLDGDLNSQKAGANYWPVTDNFGDYSYSEIASFDRLFQDLKSTEVDLNDEAVKLKADENLNLVGRVIVIHGVSSSMNLPSTVATRGKFANYQTLPIACGVIQKAPMAPGVVENEEKTWELGSSENRPGETVGGASGADDGALMREPFPIEARPENAGGNGIETPTNLVTPSSDA